MLNLDREAVPHCLPKRKSDNWPLTPEVRARDIRNRGKDGNRLWLCIRDPLGQSCVMQYTPKMTYNMIERHPHAKFLEPGQSARNSVIVTRVGNFTPERLAEQLQHAAHTSGAIAWQLTEEIQETGKALVFTGHPQDAEIVAISLKTAGITVEVIDS
ncbi:MAG: hypothetical protein J0M35_01785 [Candidatus Obscuribacter phosphatis]|uniref:Uncharacterized protein n=1 Tax=Candidatus Obscuribacter phosphatis TaxID=1906157 RepID=A0A8J7TK48_9BACT|nr:hypothetical protein [Candidatus Obscuribacter phosphatis]